MVYYWFTNIICDIFIYVYDFISTMSGQWSFLLISLFTLSQSNVASWEIRTKWSFSSLGKSSNYCSEVFPLDMAGGKSKDWWLRNQFLGNCKLCMVGNA